MLQKLSLSAAPAGLTRSTNHSESACKHLVMDRACATGAPNPYAGSIAVRSITARVPTHEDDTHDDFKPKFNTDAEPRSAPSVAEQIQNDVQQHPVFLYMKVSQQELITASC